jgi:flagellar L-ring protein FlgH
MIDQSCRNALLHWAAVGIALAVLAGCTPSTSIREPLTATPQMPKAAQADNGSIFQADVNDHPLFEDVRPHRVGDTLTVTLVESTSATQANAVDATHKGSLSANTPSAINNVNSKNMLTGIGLSADSATSLANASDSSGSNTLSGSITVTVTQVLPNGNLMVSGQKQVSVNQTDEYIRLAGVVRPADIANDNTVLSTKVADAHIEYKGNNSHYDAASMLSMVGRFFLSVLPF